MNSTDAIYEACLLRFRPIMMTTMAALLGGIPLAFGTGIGSELRRPLGIAMVGGLLLSQVLTLYTTPVIYIFFDNAGASVSLARSHTESVLPPNRPVTNEPATQKPESGRSLRRKRRKRYEHFCARALSISSAGPSPLRC